MSRGEGAKSLNTETCQESLIWDLAPMGNHYEAFKSTSNPMVSYSFTMEFAISQSQVVCLQSIRLITCISMTCTLKTLSWIPYIQVPPVVAQMKKQSIGVAIMQDSFDSPPWSIISGHYLIGSVHLQFLPCKVTQQVLIYLAKVG